MPIAKFNVGDLVISECSQNPSPCTMVMNTIFCSHGAVKARTVDGGTCIAMKGWWYVLSHSGRDYMTHETQLRKYNPPDADLKVTRRERELDNVS